MSEPAGTLVNGSCFIEDLDTDQLTAEYWDYSLQGVEDEAYARTAILMALFLVAVPLNLYVFGRILWKKLYIEPTYMLLLNLCTADLVMCFVSILFNIAMGFTGHYSFGDTDFIRCQVCKIAVMLTVVNLASAFNVALLSVDRCLYFVRPLKYSLHVTVKRTGIAILIIWLLSILIHIPVLAGYGDVGFSSSCGFIFTTHRHVQRSYALLAVNALAFSMVAVVIIVTNIFIVRAVYKQMKSVKVGTVTTMEMQTMQNREPTDARQQKREKVKRKRENLKQFKLLKVFGSILFVNFITITPAFILVIAIAFTANIPTAYYDFVVLCIAIQVTLHPVVEAFLAPQIGIKIRKACKTCCVSAGKMCCECCRSCNLCSEVTILN